MKVVNFILHMLVIFMLVFFFYHQLHLYSLAEGCRVVISKTVLAEYK